MRQKLLTRYFHRCYINNQNKSQHTPDANSFRHFTSIRNLVANYPIWRAHYNDSNCTPKRKTYFTLLLTHAHQRLCHRHQNSMFSFLSGHPVTTINMQSRDGSIRKPLEQWHNVILPFGRNKNTLNKGFY